MLSTEESRLHVQSESSFCTVEPSSVNSNGTSNSRTQKKFSNFGDVSCGEPLFAQHILIDFTPNEVTDNDIVQKKVCAFWNFIHNTPEIQNLIVLPDRSTHTQLPSTTDMSEANKSKTEYDQVIEVGKTAVSMMEFVEEKGLIDRTFEAKMPQSRCSLGSREYKENEPKTRHKAKRKLCTCTTICETCPGLMKKQISVDDTPAKRLCTKMELWDAKHPKSMEPPSHPPSLHHAVMQRQVYQ